MKRRELKMWPGFRVTIFGVIVSCNGELAKYSPHRTCLRFVIRRNLVWSKGEGNWRDVVSSPKSKFRSSPRPLQMGKNLCECG